MANLNDNNVNEYYFLEATSIGLYKNQCDYQKFLQILGDNIAKNESVEVISYNLLADSFSILMNQKSKDGIIKAMRNITNQYNSYFYEKYKVDDILLETGYKIVKVSEDDLLDCSLRIHTLNDEWLDYQNSSLRAYLYDDTEEWINKNILSDKYKTAVSYLTQLEAYGK